MIIHYRFIVITGVPINVLINKKVNKIYISKLRGLVTI